MGLFKNETPKKARRIYRVESLNNSNGIYSSMRRTKDNKKYVVCLCLTDRTIKTVFPSEFSALEQMKKYRSLYKEIKGSQH